MAMWAIELSNRLSVVLRLIYLKVMPITAYARGSVMEGLTVHDLEQQQHPQRPLYHPADSSLLTEELKSNFPITSLYQMTSTPEN